MPNFSETKWRELRQRKQCWHCSHNEVSDLCADCLATTCLFEKTGGTIGAFKPEFEKGNNWNKYPGKD